MFIFKNTAKKAATLRANKGNIFRKFRKATSGVAAIEFALTMPILIMMVAASVNFGHVIYVKHSMQAVAGEALRSVSYGQLPYADAETFAKNQLPRVGNRTPGQWDVKIVENTGTNEVTITIKVDTKLTSLMPFPYVSADIFADELKVVLVAPLITAFNPT